MDGLSGGISEGRPMSDETPTSEQRLREVLLGYLRDAEVSGWPLWPGADGLTLQDLVCSYPQAAAAGRVPGLEELLRRHPDLAAALNGHFRHR
jgi:hypothetical protein